MKTISTLISLAVLITACAPNRLEQQLTTPETAPHTPTTEEVAVNTDTPTPAAKIPPAAPTPDGRNLQPLLADASIDPDEVVTLLPPDAIPAVLPDKVEQTMITAAEADEIGIGNSTRVLGVSINGDSRAYPIPFMSSHEIVNDEVGGQLIAATW